MICTDALPIIMQFINVYAPKYETAGKFWPTVHNSMIFSLVLMHIIAVGFFTLKKVSPASTLMVPLPVLTLLFNEYCRKRFLPIFIGYSAEVHYKSRKWLQFEFSNVFSICNHSIKEKAATPPKNIVARCIIISVTQLWFWFGFVFQCLIKKDREDQNDATMTEFYDNLLNAYKDPTLLPSQYSSNRDSLRSPLISQSQF